MKLAMLLFCLGPWWTLTSANLLPETNTVSGVLWSDDDVDGVRGPSEAGLGGFRVHLRGCDDPTPITPIVITNSTGAFQFDGIRLASWRVVFQPPGLKSVNGQKKEEGTNPAVNNVDPDASQDSGFDPEEGITSCMSGQTYIDAGFSFKATVGHKVWLDMDADGVMQTADAGISGMAVVATCNDGRFKNSTWTAGGEYSLEVALGTCDIVFTVPAGNVVSGMPEGCHYADAEVACSVNVVGDVQNINFGLYPGGTVGNLVWLDSNANGIQDEAEAGLDGATVQLVNCSDNTVVDTQTTNGGGLYWFTTVPTGSFRVTFHPPTDATHVWSSTTRRSTGSTTCFALGVGEVKDTVKAGFFQADVVKSHTFTCFTIEVELAGNPWHLVALCSWIALGLATAFVYWEWWHRQAASRRAAALFDDLDIA